MACRDVIIKELNILYTDGTTLAVAFQNKKEAQFQYDYQRWYTKALKVMSIFALDRVEEFRNYYEINPKRKSLDYGTYVIQDYIMGVAPNEYRIPNFDTRKQVLICFFNQLTILKAVVDRQDSILDNIEGEFFAELQDNQIVVAKQLAKVSLRAAGTLIGVVIESHLQKIASAHAIKINKKFPTIADLNDPLKTASIINIATWRKISYLADLRNLCSHKKDSEPTKEQIEELIQGAEWLNKNVY